MYAQLLEQEGFTVEKQTEPGRHPYCPGGHLNGDIDLYPEYTSTGLLTVLKLDPIQDADQIYETVRRVTRTSSS